MKTADLIIKTITEAMAVEKQEIISVEKRLE